MRIATACAIAIALAIPVGTHAQSSSQQVQVIDLAAKKYEFTPAEIRVKRGAHVQIKLRPTDREHGLKLKARAEGAEKGSEPRLRLIGPEEIKVKENQEGVLEFVAEKPGTYEFACAKFCGFGHGKMKGKVIVE